LHLAVPEGDRRHSEFTFGRGPSGHAHHRQHVLQRMTSSAAHLFDPGEQHAVGLVQDVGPRAAEGRLVDAGQRCQPQASVRLEPSFG
jgi:hypothetical protein